MDLRGAGRTPTRIVLAVALLALILASTGRPTASAAVPSGAHVSASSAPLRSMTTDPSWDNGLIRLAFANPFPTYTVTSDQDAQVAARGGLNYVAEVDSGGRVVAVGLLRAANAAWNFTVVPTSGLTTLWLTATIPVYGTVGEWESEGGFNQNGHYLGSAAVAIAFYLNNSNGTYPNEVRFAVGVTSWPWLKASDVLGLEMSSAAAASTALMPGSSPNQLTEVAFGSQNVVSTLSWDSEALVQYGSGAFNTSVVGTYRTVAVDGSNSTIRLSFGSVGGGYSSLSYDPTVRLNLGPLGPVTLPAWQFTEESLEWIAVTLVIVMGLGLLAWRRRAAEPPPP